MSSVLEQIEQQIAKLSSKAVKKNTGVIRTVADGVAKIEGLSEVMYNEMVQFPGGAIGIALNLEEDEVGCVVLGDISKLKEGDEVQTTGRLLSVPVGKALLGRTVDALGNPVLDDARGLGVGLADDRGAFLLHGTGFFFVFYFMELLVGVIQALVFTLLTSVYIGLLCNHEGGDHAHDGHGDGAHH